MTVNLPKVNQTGKNEWADVEDNDLALKAAIETLEGGVPGALGTWYTPKVIATEEIRTNTAYGTLTTADEVKEVVISSTGLAGLIYEADFGNTEAEKGRAAIFLGANQMKVRSIAAGGGAMRVQEARGSAASGVNGQYRLMSTPAGLMVGGAAQADVETGQAVAVAADSGKVFGYAGEESFSFNGFSGGICLIRAAPGTYNISIRFKASVGSVSAKNRRLDVFTLG